MHIGLDADVALIVRGANFPRHKVFREKKLRLKRSCLLQNGLRTDCIRPNIMHFCFTNFARSHCSITFFYSKEYFGLRNIGNI